jgi:predicted alpha/beta-fold hydrolase
MVGFKRSAVLRASLGVVFLLSFTIRAIEAPLATTPLPTSKGSTGSASEFDYAIDDGLYATVTSMQSFKKPDIKDERKIKLTHIDGFKKEIQVRAILQPEPAPLAVIFLGLTSKSKDPLSRLWQSQLQEAGCHVLVFDSVFRSSFNECSGHGVCGNIQMEAWIAANVIRAFLDHPDVQGKVTKLGLIGASYGGILALNFAKLAKEGQLKIVPDRVLVFSPPVSMQCSATLLDKYYDEDRQRFGFLDLLKLKGAEPVASGKAVPFSASLMRAGIGYVFREDLEEAISCSRDKYQYKLPDPPKDDNKKTDEKNKHQFTRFIEQVVFPYWNKQGRVRSMQDLWEFGDLYKLLQSCGDNVHAVLTADDPLNEPALLKFVERDIPSSKVTILPRGGHLGFIGCNWSRDRVMQLFK